MCSMYRFAKRSVPKVIFTGTKYATLASRSTMTLLTVKFRQPSHEFTFGVGMSFIPYPLVLTPLV
jgi:hypothetical protein